MTSLAGKRALVTGAGSGIGAAIAERFASLGAHVWATDRDDRTAGDTARRIRAGGGSADTLTLDVTDSAAAVRAAELVHARGGVDILVNNAGIGHVGTIMQATADDLDRLYALNVRGVFNVTKAFLPAMIARHSGTIVHIASVGEFVGLLHHTSYCTAKFLIVG